MDINIGIPNEQREEVTAGLSRLLADTCTLYLCTRRMPGCYAACWNKAQIIPTDTGRPALPACSTGETT
ncbi:MAG TPA: hypothetical protein PLB10_06465 [Thiolinea sp.]|nr:hypothetical protein [Thiolinea sp.]